MKRGRSVAVLPRRRRRWDGMTATQRRLELERLLVTLGYRALRLAYRKAHLGPAWVAHFEARSRRLFSAALDTWRRDV